MDFDDLDIATLRRRTGEKWNTYPKDILPAWVADMDFLPCGPIRELLQQRIEIGDIGYPDDASYVELREAYVDRAEQRYGWRIDVDRVVPLTDVVQGIYGALLTLTDPGDGALVQPPIYPPFLHAVPESRREMILNPLAEVDGRYEIDLDDLQQRIGPRTRMLLFCNPQNPTGRAFSRGELEALAEVVLRNDLLVCSDEIHADLVLSGGAHIPFASLSPEIAERAITLTSATKAFNIAGLRCAVAHFGSADLQQRYAAIPEHYRGGLGGLGLAATVAAWRSGQPWLDEVLAYLERNRALVESFVDARLPGVRHRAPQATYLAWLDCRDLQLDSSPYEHFLRRARVALSDGAAFGAVGEGFVRLNFATSHSILEEILHRMASALA